jgi:predicted ATPase/DNA-binding winged helix-turn-helix (wHTH) protein
MSGPTQQRFYQFGPFRVDVEDRILTRAQQVIPLNLKTFEILVALVENAGKVLTKDVLMKKVWPDSFVEEGNLTKGIFVLRKVLGDRPGGGPWIETLPKRGYRFTVEPAASSDFGNGEIVFPKVHFPPSLPAPRNSFVGRQEDLSCLSERLLHQSVRLLTITGPGGTGKTRLALELARTLQTVFAGGIHFVGLSSLAESSDVIPVIARSFGFSNPGGKFGGNVLGDQLEVSLSAPTLLVLDNYEHLLASAGIVASLLDGCHLLKILVTSRAVLRVYGENEYVLLPLPLPDVEHLPELSRLASNPAVALFLHRVASVKPDFALTAENACDVAGICTRLDGLPLAIELAAARMKMLSAADLLQRLQARLQVLTGGPLDAPARQQTLRQTIDWSYGLLNESQQKLFRRVSVFSGGFTAESAEAVCNARVDLETDALEATCSLIDHSLVLRTEGVQGHIRFTMLETVREYALERLTVSGEEEFTRRAHAAYCLVIAEEGNAKTLPADRESWLATCDAEHYNLRAALAWLIEKQQSEWALRMAVALFAFWESREHLAEGCQSLNAALLLPTSPLRTRLRAGALWRLGALVGFRGDFKQSMRLHGEALNIYLEVGTKKEIAFELATIGAGRMLLGEYEQAESWYR